MKFKFLLLFIFASSLVLQASVEQIVKLKTKEGVLEGSLLVPKSKKPLPLVLIIAGSGPTDRNGNNPSMVNNSLKMLAQALAKNNIASLRYDKRGIAKSANAFIKEKDLRFEDYVLDAVSWMKYIKKDKRFNSFIILGHSEGSLIAMLAANKIKLDKYISVAGVSRNAHKIILEQLKAQSSYFHKQALKIIKKLNEGKIVHEIPEKLYALFRPSVQPYMISWFKYNPSEEIKKLNIPILIVHGRTDIQVPIKDAKFLHEANKNSKKVLIEEMNHILKAAPMNRLKNIHTYYKEDLPIKEELVEHIVSFIKNK